MSLQETFLTDFAIDSLPPDDIFTLFYPNARIMTSDGTSILIRRPIGGGAFSNVFEVEIDNSVYALKVSHQSNESRLQFEYEEQALVYINQNCCTTFLVKYFFSFELFERKCLVMELCGCSLFSKLELQKFQGFPLFEIQTIIQNCLSGLVSLSDAGLIHSDVKPENILLNKTSKISDFGSVCFSPSSQFYCQSRYYRAPEVLMKLEYSDKIDVWSLGCVAVELFVGLPLFPGESEVHMLILIEKMFGIPVEMIDKSELTCFENGKINEDYEFEHYFVTEDFDELILNYFYDEKVPDDPHAKDLFIDLTKKMLTVNPDERISAREALSHEFFLFQF